MNITESQKQIILHSLGHNGYRNHFCAEVGHRDYQDLMILVDAGLMTKRKDPFDEMNESFVFHVTKEGQELVGVHYNEED